MLLWELFQDGLDVKGSLLQAALDILTPMIAHKLPFVTVQQMVDELRHTRPGIVVDRALVLDLLDPSRIKAVSKIEGDRIYLTPTEGKGVERETSDKQAETEIERIKDKARKQAKKEIQDKP